MTKTFSFEKVVDPDFPFYNGGWVKRVTGLDKSVQNGYSITGEFVEKSGKFIHADGLYLVCDVQGSRKKQEKNYILIRLTDQKPEILKTVLDGERDWAIKFWDVIEENLIVKVSEKEKAIQQIHGIQWHVAAVRRTRFKQIIEPGDEIALLVEPQPATNDTYLFQITTKGEITASGIVVMKQTA